MGETATRRPIGDGAAAAAARGGGAVSVYFLRIAAALAAYWRCTEAEAWRRALRMAGKRERVE